MFNEHHLPDLDPIFSYPPRSGIVRQQITDAQEGIRFKELLKPFYVRFDLLVGTSENPDLTIQMMVESGNCYREADHMRVFQ